jgi:aminopeptidase N
MKDVADMWIHEGFCTYSEVLYVEYFHGKEAALKYVNAMKSRVSNDEPIIGDYEVNNEGSGDMYNKGALMIHSLRNWLNNDSLFVAMLKSIQTEFAYQTVETKQIENYMAQLTGLNLKPFFNQYLRSAELPELQYYFEGKSNLFYRWKAAKGFQMPVAVSTKKDKMEQVTPTEKWQRVSVKLKPSQFKIDESRGYFSVKQIASEAEAQ